MCAYNTNDECTLSIYTGEGALTWFLLRYVCEILNQSDLAICG